MSPIHFQPPQMNALRLYRNRKRTQLRDIVHFSKSRARDWQTGSAWNLVQRFAKRTTIHGINRILNEEATVSERFIWLLTFLLALGGSTYVCLILSKRFSQGSLQTVIHSTRLDVFRIPFPVVTVCNRNSLNWQRLAEAKRHFLPDEKSPAKLELFERIVGTYDGVRFGDFRAFSALQNESLAMMNHINFTLVADFMSWRCEELLADCVWRHVRMDCCNIFFKRRTMHGFCLAFNTLESEEGMRRQQEDPWWPWHTEGAGLASGLTLRVIINPEKHYPHGSPEKGVNVMITEPKAWNKSPIFIPEYSNSVLVIEPIMFFHDNDTHSLPSEKRECVFDGERNSLHFKTLQGYVYMIENCQAECQQQYLVRYCNCTLEMLFPPGPYRSCQATDLPCLAKNNDYFLYTHQPGEEEYAFNLIEGMRCPCYRNCLSLNYLTDARRSLMPNVGGNLSYVDLDVHFRFQSLMAYRTNLIFGWVDLMVAFGGIVGLFLGCSLISGMEIVYFVTVELPTFAVEQIKEWHQRRTAVQNTNYGISNRVLAAERHNHKDHVINGHNGGVALWNGSVGNGGGVGGAGVARDGWFKSSFGVECKPQRIQCRPVRCNEREKK